ncbi:autotransporter domain-containing protein [Proteus terrae]|uniref:autotransporter domain-containing protein n=1 Tax=Proteus terrae TaxID=1574161 RepID=UPI0035234D91
MLINKNKLKISIIISLIITPSLSYSKYITSELIETSPIDFKFYEVNKNNLTLPNNFYHHGKLSSKTTPTILSSKYSNIIILSNNNKNSISYDAGVSFQGLEIEHYSNINFLSLSEDGRYITAHGNHLENKEKNVLKRFFIYDTYLKTVHQFNSKEDTYYDKEDYFLTTKDGRFSLYADYSTEYETIKEANNGYLPYNKMSYFIYDNKTKKTISLKDIENTDINNHLEKNRFKSFLNLDFINDIIDRKPILTGISFDGKYLYGTLNRTSSISESKPAFIYDSINNTINFISKSEYGDAKINAMSKNNIAVGWLEDRVKYKNERNQRLLRQAFIYDAKDNKTIIPSRINPDNSDYYNSEATGISDNGNTIVGWVEQGYKRNINRSFDYNKDLESRYPRSAFIYFRDNNTSLLLPNLNHSNELESEAHAISSDGKVAFGVANNKDNIWRFVSWKIEEANKIDKDYQALIANNNISSMKNIVDNLSLDINKEREKIRLALLEKQKETEKRRKEANLNKLSLEKKLDDPDLFNKYIGEYTKYQDNEALAQNELDNIKNTLNNFESLALTPELKAREYQYNVYKEALDIQQGIAIDKNKEDQDKTTTEKERLAEIAKQQEQVEKARLAEIAKQQEQAEKERLAEVAKQQEQAEKARLAQIAKQKEQAEKEHLAQIAKQKEQAEKARLAEVAKQQEQAEKEHLAQIAKQKEQAEKEHLAQIAKQKEQAEKEHLAQIAKQKEQAEKERLAEIAKQKEQAEKARLAEIAKQQEQAEKERLAEIAKQQEQAEKARLAEIAKQQEQAEKERLAKEILPVEDELALRTKEKADTKPSVVISKPIDIENTHKSMQLIAENSYKLMDMQQGQLRYLASATCSVGTKKACISGFAHYQNVNKANATQTGLSGAYRFDINHIPLIVGLAIDTDVYSSLPKGYQYQGYALPLIGFSLDLMPSLNAELNNNALHLSLKGAYLSRKVSIERQALEDTEAGKGDARLSGYHIDFQGYYPYSLSDNLLLTPFVGLTFNQISRSAYSETQNAQFLVHYDALKTHSLLAKMGLGMEYLLGSSFIFNTKAGLLWSLSHHQDDFRSHIDYIGQQKINYADNKKQLKQRPFANVGLTYQFDNQSSVNTSANWEMTTYRNHDMQIGVSYTYRF